MNDPIVWIVDDDESIRWVVEKALQKAGIHTRSFVNGSDCLAALRCVPASVAARVPAPALLITDIRMPDISGHELMQELPRLVSGLPVIVITAHGDLDATVRAYEAGALEMLPKPFDVSELVAITQRLLADAPGTVPVADQANAKADSEAAAELIGSAASMQRLYRVIGRLSRAAMPVLITGESGTGKELIARTLHERSPRAARPFVAINTAAIPAELLESELFGHERGAFTGAHAQRQGRFEQAEGGTLFLDEIGDMPLAMQTRLLRVLSEKEFFRVGGHRPIRTDVRVIAATHQDLPALISAGRFREDLYHRLNVVRLEVPPLRERREDIPALAKRFLLEAAEEMDVDNKVMAAQVMHWLQQQDWPGNVRELRNFCRRATALAPGATITLEDIDVRPVPAVESASDNFDNRLDDWLDALFARETDEVAVKATAELERAIIRRALEQTGGHRQNAARLLGWGRNTLARKMREYGIDPVS